MRRAVVVTAVVVEAAAAVRAVEAETAVAEVVVVLAAVAAEAKLHVCRSPHHHVEAADLQVAAVAVYHNRVHPVGLDLTQVHVAR